MEPVEINAGIWYLRALRADDRIDDRPNLVDLGLNDPDFVTECTARWNSGTGYSWAVCEPTTGEMLAVVLLNVGAPGSGLDGAQESGGGDTTVAPPGGLLTVHSRRGYEEAGAAGADAVRRFAASALNIQVRS
jgi:hypothetical protein